MSARRGTADRPAGRGGDDAGVTLVELVVAMGVFLTVLSVVMGAVIGFSSLTVKTQNLADATGELRTAYLRLDRDVRYASSLSTPGRVGDDYFVEATVPVAGSATVRCVQWRYHAQDSSLQVRRWNKPAGAASAAPPATWTTLARTLAVDTASPPFTVTPVGAVPSPGGTAGPGVALNRQQLSVHLLVQRGSGARAGATAIDTAFIARNSTAPQGADVPVTSADCGTAATIRSTS